MAKRSFRGLFSADHHKSNALPYSRPSADGRTDRLDHQLANWDQMREYALKHKVDGVFLLGDLFDKARLDPVTLAETAAALRRLAEVAPLNILPGNHDALTIKGERFNVEVFKNIDGIRYIDAEQPLDVGPVVFWPLEYMTAEATREQLEGMRLVIRESGCGPNVLLFHNSVIGCSHLAWLCDDGLTPDEMLEGFDWAIGGHFHTHQRFGDGDRGMYCGAWMQHDFGDVGEDRGFWDITWKDGKRKDKLVTAQSPKFHTAEPAVIPETAERGDYIRWEVHCTHAEYEGVREQLEKAKGLAFKRGFRVDYKHKPVYQHAARIVTTDEMSTVSMREMVDRYVDSDDIELGQLKAKRLKRLGAEIMAEAEID